MQALWNPQSTGTCMLVIALLKCEGGEKSRKVQNTEMNVWLYVCKLNFSIMYARSLLSFIYLMQYSNGIVFLINKFVR